MVIAAVRVDTVRDTARFDVCLGSVSADRRARVLSLVKPEDQRRSLCAGLALDACLRTVGLREASEPITRDEHGRPLLTAHPAWQFSLSHSGDWAVCVLADAPVGIDVERVRPVRTEALARRYFTAQESALLMSLSAAERQTAFFRLWTAKESVLKAQGAGLSGGLAVPIGYGDSLTAPTPWKLREYAFPGYQLTVCGTGEFPTEPIIFSSYDSVPLR